MTREELNYIKDAFSQIIYDIAGNPDWYEAARVIASDLGTLERKLEKKIFSIPSNLDEAAEEYERNLGYYECMNQWPSVAFKAGAEWMAGQGSSREVEVKEDAGGYPYIPSIELYDYDKDKPLAKAGDKVKLIVIKEEDEK